ncbi:MAG TPA: NTF2-like N-terminal transpeptidase domain-containing protein [Geobacteraceae bacterium]
MNKKPWSIFFILGVVALVAACNGSTGGTKSDAVDAKATPAGIAAGTGEATTDSGGVSSETDGARNLLNTYFSSAVKQDYATTYTCYYRPYKQKISKEEFIKHRKEASALNSYRILSITKLAGNNAKADVELTFAPSKKLLRKEPKTIKVVEDLVKEGDGWKIKVW